MAKTNTFDPEALIQSQIVGLDEAIERIDKRLEKFKALNEKKNRLLAARRALLGGNRLTGAGGTRLQLEDIQDYLKNNPGVVVSQIADRFGVAVGTVSSHIYRNKGLFTKDGDGGLHNAGEDDHEEV